MLQQDWYCLQVLMLRRCLTWLRATWVVKILPLDQNILLHQIVGYAIFIFTLVHTMAHVMNFGNHVSLRFFHSLLMLCRCIFTPGLVVHYT